MVLVDSNWMIKRKRNRKLLLTSTIIVFTSQRLGDQVWLWIWGFIVHLRNHWMSEWNYELNVFSKRMSSNSLSGLNSCCYESFKLPRQYCSKRILYATLRSHMAFLKRNKWECVHSSRFVHHRGSFTLSESYHKRNFPFAQCKRTLKMILSWQSKRQSPF